MLITTYWLDDQEKNADTPWHACLILGVLALWGAHALLVLRARRRTDPLLVSAVVWTSIAAGGFAMLITDLAILAILDADDSGPFPRLIGVVLVIVILLTALPPVAAPRRRLWGLTAAERLEFRFDVAALSLIATLTEPGRSYEQQKRR